MTINLWADRFLINLSTEKLRNRVERQGEKVTGLADLPCELANVRLEAALKATFVLTANTESALRELLGIAHAHAAMHYPTKDEFVRQLYLPKKRDPYPARCLTGAAGTGKTQLFAAFERACKPRAVIQAIGGHGPFMTEPAKQIRIEGMQSVSQILTSIALLRTELI